MTGPEVTTREVGTAEPAGREPEVAAGALARSDARFGQLLLAPTLLVVVVVVVLPILWTVVLAFQDLRLIDLRRRGLFGAFTLDNFAAVFGSPGFCMHGSWTRSSRSRARSSAFRRSCCGPSTLRPSKP